MNLCNFAQVNLELQPGDVHIWYADLDPVESELNALERLLSPEEHARAEGFHFRRDRDRFVCAHGLLRTILASYSGQDAAGLQFGYGQFGKPRLIGPSHFLNFNSSRSANAGLFGFARGRAVGVDIEQILENEEFLDIAVQYYTPAERLLLEKVDRDLRMARFFHCWTRREAYLKATGEGIGYLTNDLNVTSRVVASSDGSSAWRIETVSLIPGYAISLAAAGTDWRLTTFKWAEAARAINAARQLNRGRSSTASSSRSTNGTA